MNIHKSILISIILMTLSVTNSFSNSVDPRCADNAKAVSLSNDDKFVHLVPVERITHRFIGNGSWSDPVNWCSHRLPSNGAHVLVAKNAVAILNQDWSSTKLHTLRIDGSFRMAMPLNQEENLTQNAMLRVVTMVVTSSGQFYIGAENKPTDPDIRAVVTFAGRGDYEYRDDPTDHSGGLLVEEGGTVGVYGARRTSYAKAHSQLVQGSDYIELSEPQEGWEVGDRIVVPGIHPWKRGETEGDPTDAEDEVFTIRALSDRVVFLGDKTDMTLPATLQYDHVPPLVTGVNNKPLQIPIGNLDRNVVFRSEDKRRPHRGHILFVNATPAVHIEFARFENLGRTDTRFEFAGWGDPDVKPRNTKGRYPVHFHQVDKASYDNPPHVIRGSVIEGSLKHGVVNHGGYVNLERNVGYNNAGSHFFMENGQEIGTVKENLAVFSRGSNTWTFNGNPNGLPRSRSGDFGHAGHGFWGHGGGVIFADNFAFSHAHAAYIFYPLGITTKKNRFEKSSRTDPKLEPFAFNRAKLIGGHDSVDSDRAYFRQYLSDKAILHAYLENKGRDSLHIRDVPIYTVGNVGVSSLDGIRIGFRAQPAGGDLDYCLKYYPCTPADIPASISKDNLHRIFKSYIVDSQFWNNRESGVFYGYAMLGVLSSLTLVSDPNSSLDIGIKRNDNDINGYNDYENLLIMGFNTGIELPLQGDNTVNHVRLIDNRAPLYLQTAAGPRSISMTGVSISNSQSNGISGDPASTKDGLELSEPVWYQGGSIGDLFYKDEVTLNGERILFPDQQKGGNRPRWLSKLADLLGLSDSTELESVEALWEHYGLAIGGQLEGAANFTGNFRLVNRCVPFQPLNNDERRVYVYDEDGNFIVNTYPPLYQSGWHILANKEAGDDRIPKDATLVHVGPVDLKMVEPEEDGVGQDLICRNAMVSP